MTVIEWLIQNPDWLKALGPNKTRIRIKETNGETSLLCSADFIAPTQERMLEEVGDLEVISIEPMNLRLSRRVDSDTA